MSFNALFMAHAPDANPDDVALVETPTYKLYSVAIKNQAEALATARKLVDEKGVESILLCPGFTNRDIAGLCEALGDEVGVSVARGDRHANMAAMKAMQREGWMR
jgi:stage V sporulation protein SpoVS